MHGWNHRIPTRELSADVQISYSAVQSIITEGLSTRLEPVKFVLKMFSADLKETRVSLAQDLFEWGEND